MSTKAEVIALTRKKIDEAKQQLFDEFSDHLSVRIGIVNHPEFVISGDLKKAYEYLKLKFEDKKTSPVKERQQ